MDALIILGMACSGLVVLGLMVWDSFWSKDARDTKLLYDLERARMLERKTKEAADVRTNR